MRGRANSGRSSSQHKVSRFPHGKEFHLGRDSRSARFVEGAPTNVRYRVLVLTFVLAFIMYLDRVCMGTAQPMIMREFNLDKITIGWSVSAFLWSYAIFQIPAGGWRIDTVDASCLPPRWRGGRSSRPARALPSVLYRWR